MYLQIGKEACDDKVFQMNIEEILLFRLLLSFDQTRRSSLGSFIFFKIRFLSRSSNNIFISFIVSLTKAKKKGLELKTGLVKEVN